MEQNDFCNENRKRLDSKMIVTFQLVSIVTQTANKQKDIQRPRERLFPLKRTVPAICRNQTGGLTDNPPISLAHSRRPVEGAAKMETQ